MVAALSLSKYLVLGPFDALSANLLAMARSWASAIAASLCFLGILYTIFASSSIPQLLWQSFGQNVQSSTGYDSRVEGDYLLGVGKGDITG